MRSYSTLRAATALALLLSGCSGGSGVSPSPIASSLPAVTPAGEGLLTLRFEIPRNSTSTAIERSPQYLSYGTQSLVISIAQGANAPSTTIVNTGSTSANCQESPNQSTLVCTTGILAPVGTDSITVTAYDQQQGPNAKAPYTGNVLSSITNYPATVTPGTSTSVVVTLTGTPVTTQVALSPTQVPAGTAAMATVSVFAFDAAGYLILGTYSSPVAIADSDTSGVTTLSAASVTASGAPVTLTYSGGALPNGASITSKAGATTSAAALFTAVAPGAHNFVYYGINGGNLDAVQIYDFANTTQVAGQPANQRTVQPNAFVGRSAIFGLGPNNETFFANGDFFGPQSVPVSAGATEPGNTKPIATLTYTPPNSNPNTTTAFQSVDVSPDGRLFQSYTVSSNTNTGLLGVWAEGTSGNAPPAYSFTTPDGLRHIRFDRQGNLWAIGSNAVSEYSAASLAAAGPMHPITPITQITYASNNGIPVDLLSTAFDLAFDAEGNIYLIGEGNTGTGPTTLSTNYYGFSNAIRGTTVVETAAAETFTYNHSCVDIDVDPNPSSTTFDSLAVEVGENSQQVVFFQTLSQMPPANGTVATPYYSVMLNTDGNATGGLGTSTLRFGH